MDLVPYGRDRWSWFWKEGGFSSTRSHHGRVGRDSMCEREVKSWEMLYVWKPFAQHDRTSWKYDKNLTCEILDLVYPQTGNCSSNDFLLYHLDHFI